MLPSCPFVGAVTAETSQLLGVQRNVSVENEPGTKPVAQVAAVQSATLVLVHTVHVWTDGSDEKSLQQNPPIDVGTQSSPHLTIPTTPQLTSSRSAHSRLPVISASCPDTIKAA